MNMLFQITEVWWLHTCCYMNPRYHKMKEEPVFSSGCKIQHWSYWEKYDT